MSAHRRSRVVFTCLVVAAALLGCVLAGCGGGKGGLSTALDPSSVSSPPEAPRSLAQVYAEIDAAETPPGVEQELFDRLKEALKSALTGRGSSAIPVTPPLGEKNKVTDLEVVDPAHSNYYLQWTYVNVGDYNQDKLVGVSDLTPVGLHFQKNEQAADWDKAELCDGICDGLITVSDITPIGQNFNARLEGYQVQRASSEEGPWDTVDTVPFGDPGGDPRKRFMYLFTTLEAGYYRVVPANGMDTGEPSNVVQTFGTAKAPEITAVTPLGGNSGDAVAFSATVTGTAPLTYAWDFGTGATPNTSDEAEPAVTLGAGGDYEASLTVTNVVDSAVFDFTLSVTGLNPPHISAISQTGEKTGEQATFTPAYTAGEDPAFAWDFGGGATPNTSDEEAPTVVLGEVGHYDASLTLTDAGGNDVFEFDLDVVSDVDPPHIIDIMPRSGYEGQALTFNVNFTASGTASFAWDFGGGATPNTCTTRNAAVVLGSANTYNAQLVVTDEYGIDSYPFNLVVSSTDYGSPQVLDVQPRAGESGETLTINATVIGEPPLSYSWSFGGGATPDTSSDQAPLITLGAPGAYSASLEVENSQGSYTYPFGLYVGESGGLSDLIVAVPQTYDVFAGRTIPITVACFETANPFHDLLGVRVSFNDSCEYSSGSFNVGARGGGRNYGDGAVWSAVGADWLEVPDDTVLQEEISLGGGRKAIDFWIHPLGGQQITNASGELFSFSLRVSPDVSDGDTVSIGIMRLGAASNSRTYFAEEDDTEHFWDDDDNASVPAVDVCKPSFILTNPPVLGDGSAGNPYVVSGGQTYTFQVQTVKWGDVTLDPRTTWYLGPPGSGDLVNGDLTVDTQYQGGLAVQLHFDTYPSNWFYFEVPLTYGFGSDSIVAVPTKTTAYAGEHVGIVVYISETANPFKFMNGAGVTLETGNRYVDTTFNVGVPGGYQADADGVWLDVAPVDFLLPTDWMIQETDIGGGRARIDFNVTPLGGGDITNATGAMFNFEIEVTSDVLLGFELFHDVKRTYYSDGSSTEYNWSDLTNNHPGVPNSITLVPGP